MHTYILQKRYGHMCICTSDNNATTCAYSHEKETHIEYMYVCTITMGYGWHIYRYLYIHMYNAKKKKYIYINIRRKALIIADSAWTKCNELLRTRTWTVFLLFYLFLYYFFFNDTCAAKEFPVVEFIVWVDGHTLVYRRMERNKRDRISLLLQSDNEKKIDR